MTVKSSNVNVTDIDFEDISRNLKSYLSGQEEFKDYNFEGSTLSILIDLLTYSSHISSLNTNIAVSELFLDSAQIRKNVVSRAKDLGFIPGSETASTATINLSINGVLDVNGNLPSINDMILPLGSKFETVYDGTTFTFVTTNTYKPTQNGQSYLYDGIEISQGVWVEDVFVFDSQVKSSKFVLSNQRADRNRFYVDVLSGGTTTTFSLAVEVNEVTTTSEVYYLQENEDGFTEVYFGDGFLGKQLLDGDVITVRYLVVDTIHADGARTFNFIDSVGGFTNATIGVVENASGGSEKESIDSIKFKATKFYTSQNRLVTLNDYKSKIAEYYPNADAVAVWGGEDNDPPEYGKVFVAIKPQNSDYLTENEKFEVTQNLNRLNMLTVRPEVISPELISILVTTNFKYNKNATSLSQGELENLVTNQILEWDNRFLNNFDSIFRHSNLVSFIDQTNAAILSNITNIRLKKTILPPSSDNTSTGYDINFGNPFYHPVDGYNAEAGGILSTDGFYVSGDSINKQYFDEDGMGNLRRYVISGSSRIYRDLAAGTVDYTKGRIEINSINITDTESGTKRISFTIIPASYDVVAVRGNLIDIASEGIKVEGSVDTISSGETSAGVGFTTTQVTEY